MFRLTRSQDRFQRICNSCTNSWTKGSYYYISKNSYNYYNRMEQQLQQLQQQQQLVEQRLLRQQLSGMESTNRLSDGLDVDVLQRQAFWFLANIFEYVLFLN